MDRQDVGTASIIRGDALNLSLADNSVDLIVTSPPYFALRSYQDGGEHYEGQIGSEPTPADFVDALVAATAEMIRVLKPSGSIWVNLGDKYSSGGRSGYDITDMNGARGGRNRSGDAGFAPKTLLGIPWRYALRCIDDLGLILRAEVIWSKPNGMPESVTDRVRRSHEQWFHFTIKPQYFSSIDEIREDHKPGQSPAALSFSRIGRETSPGQTMAPHRIGREDQGLNPLGKLPGSVWSIATQPLTVPEWLGIDHFAAFPMEWPRRIIKGFCPEAGIVLDPFGGTGTTALVAKALGRHGISNDMSSDYCRLATWRTNDEGELARAMQVDKPREQVKGQSDLFDMLGNAS